LLPHSNFVVPAQAKLTTEIDGSQASLSGKEMGMIDSEFTPRERALILRYGYSFDQIKEALQAVASSKRIEIVSLDEFEVERLIGDLCRSINHEEGCPRIQLELDELCSRIEYAQRTGDGELDALW
jgi:hypothetical protein